MSYTAHLDSFARDHLPPPELLPEFLFELPELQNPGRINCAVELLDAMVSSGHGPRVALRAPGLSWTYAELLAAANRVANVLVSDLGLVPGNRVLLHGSNTPMMAACWFAVLKAGGIAVVTMPLLRAGELTSVVSKAEVSHALCEKKLEAELMGALPDCPTLGQIRFFASNEPDGLEALMAAQPESFANADTASDDTCLIAFTSGTTGQPKGTMHFHRDVLAICDTFARHVLRASPDDVFIGSPPLAFTFGLGGALLFPMRIGASSVLLEKAAPELLLAAIAVYRASVCFTAPTSYRAMAPHAAGHDLGSLRKCVSAGEALPAATRALWREATGIELIDGIGATEMLHIFISADEAHARPGATGLPVPGYRACVLDDEGLPLPPGRVGRLAVKGPTGCRYLADDRQRNYVQNGWNLTGDAYLVDGDGYFVYQARTDDMIVSSGYNIAGPEVEVALLGHPDVAECAVVGVPDPERGQVARAYVVLRPGVAPSGELARALQDFVKATIAPYKYPRQVEFRDTLPRTQTGKLQRYRLRQEARGEGEAGGLSVLQPPGWPRPRGYANGIAGRGTSVFIAGMIGWNSQGHFESPDFVAQARQALENIVLTLAEAGGKPEHLVRLTWFVVSKREYLEALPRLGPAYRAVLGAHYPAMSVVEVSALIEDEARVEIEATALIP